MIFRQATVGDDEAISRLLKQTPLEGKFRLLYLREPSFHRSMETQGKSHQTLVGEENGEILALCTCAFQEIYVEGIKYKAGYIGNARVHPKARNGITLYRGFKYFKSLQDNDPADFYFTSLIDANKHSLALFTRNRLDLPPLADMGKISTYILPLKRKKQSVRKNPSYEIVQADEKSMNEALNFLSACGTTRNFFPSVQGYHSSLMNPDNFFVMYEKGRIVGTAGVFDLNFLKQYILDGYLPPYNFLRLFMSAGLQSKGFYSLPKPGNEVKIGVIGFPIVLENNPELFSFLLRHILSYFSGRGLHYLMVGLHERDPLASALKHIPHLRYDSRLYLVELNGNPLSKKNEPIESIPFIDLPRF